MGFLKKDSSNHLRGSGRGQKIQREPAEKRKRGINQNIYCGSGKGERLEKAYGERGYGRVREERVYWGKKKPNNYTQPGEKRVGKRGGRTLKG